MVQIIKGDEVSIRGVVTNVGDFDVQIWIRDAWGRNLTIYVKPNASDVTHHPRPREIKAGSIVRHKSEGGTGDTQEILFRDRDDCVYRGYRCLTTVNVSQLEWVGQRDDAKA